MTVSFDQLEDTLGYKFKQPDLLKRALTHSSFGQDNNERLEFLGDAVVDLAVSDALIRRFPASPEGELSRMRASLVSRETMAEMAREFDLGVCLRLGAGELKSGGSGRESNLANAFEAIVGAIFQDAGYQACADTVLCWYDHRLQNLRPGQRDAKSKLQEHLQAGGLELPQYETKSVSGPPQAQQFTVCCSVDGLDKPTEGTGSSRRKAEQSAAQAALLALGVNDE